MKRIPRQLLVIEDNAVIGSGAVVTKDVQPGITRRLVLNDGAAMDGAAMLGIVGNSGRARCVIENCGHQMRLFFSTSSPATV